VEVAKANIVLASDLVVVLDAEGNETGEPLDDPVVVFGGERLGNRQRAGQVAQNLLGEFLGEVVVNRQRHVACEAQQNPLQVQLFERRLHDDRTLDDLGAGGVGENSGHFERSFGRPTLNYRISYSTSIWHICQYLDGDVQSLHEFS
jgi:hypothetical protein